MSLSLLFMEASLLFHCFPVHCHLLCSSLLALFVIKLVVNEALPGVSHCFLRISDSSVDLRDLDPTQMIVSWQLTSIRRHTWTPLSLVLEIGR